MILANACMLTTIDNPFNPFDDFSSWYQYDMEKGYNSCGYLDRIAKTRPDMTQKEYEEENERAIDEIVRLNPLCIYKKVLKNSNSNPEPVKV